jgi:hypothetical protein
MIGNPQAIAEGVGAATTERSAVAFGSLFMAVAPDYFPIGDHPGITQCMAFLMTYRFCHSCKDAT